MIQAPQVQYIPAQQPVQVANQQGTYSPVQYTQQQTPGVIYNYPTASSYLPAQNGKSQFNGVNIEILNPQGQGFVPQAMNQAPVCMPAQFMPVQQPVVMPAPVVTEAPAAAPVVQQDVQAVPAPQVDSSIAQVAPQVQPVVQQPAAENAAVDPAAFAGKLNTEDLDAQTAAIEEIAQIVKEDQTAGPILLDTQVFDALVAIINKDTSALEAPTPEVIELRQKPQDQLTEDEKVKATTPSPLEKAEINKQYALYTIAYMQERLNKELEVRNGQALELKDLPCIEQVITTAKSNPNPMLRIGALAALSHIARPEYSADLTTIFELAKADEDVKVQEAATKAAQSLQPAPATQPAQPTEEAKPAEQAK